MGVRNVVKAKSFTESERLLAKLAEKAFLTLWSFPNVYKDEGISKGQGEELCDLLVVFGDHVIIFSDKGDVAYKPTESVPIGWGRWVNRAFLKGSFQAYQAEKWIRDYPERLFLDKECKNPFPIKLPSCDKVKIHRVVVVRGITEAASKFYKDESGTLILSPDIVGKEHFSKPFMIGRPAKGKGYVHLFDEVSIDLVLGKLDTIIDFVNYLEKKEALINMGRLSIASGEDDLLAYYLTSYEIQTDEDVPCFLLPKGGERIVVQSGFYNSFKSSDLYYEMEQMKRPSYFWDRIIEIMGEAAFTGAWSETTGINYDQEITVLRYMASESRIARSMLSVAVQEIITRPFPPSEKLPRVRLMQSTTNPEVCYVWLVLPQSPDLSDYADYRKVRKNFLSHYCYACKDAIPSCRIIVGVACDTINNIGASEELIYIHTDEWGPEEYKEAKRIRQELGFLLNVTISSQNL